MSEGFRIKKSWTRVESSLVEAFRSLPVANVSDSMQRLNGVGNHLQPMHREGVLAGPALTVRSRPGDNLMLHKAIDMAQPGDVIVHDAGGDLTNSLIGELMLVHAKVCGVAGIVIYGALRDREAFLRLNLPVYALGVTHRGPYRDGPGEIGFPISIEGMLIAPGDLMLGDADGLLAVPRLSAEAILEKARAKNQAEQRQLEATLAGKLDRSWVDRVLAEKGCEIIE
ncbi:RraA family protein [Telmatospirillum sp. J64-1]|uniref:RraA family protein n=1 Tax=Telmatospirillum sp. J64-1 TaxID=2502183 RepID=UPI00115F1565|nr:RraA family protein [Telmatospirillum sp. J64-1]